LRYGAKLTLPTHGPNPEEPDPKHPVVCFDESPMQLIGEVRQPIPAAPGQFERYDYEYKRNGTANVKCLDRRIESYGRIESEIAA
jgi:hypothetical protein